MRRSHIPFWFVGSMILALNSGRLIGADYRIVQITTDNADHRWPSINNRGDMVWSQQYAGKWQVYRRTGPATSPSTATNILAPDYPNHNYKYPAISDTGDIVYLRDNNPRNNGGSDLQVVRNSNGTETIVEFSTRNINLDLSIAAAHDAGRHFGIASSGTSISYFDFSRTNSPAVRRFDIGGAPVKNGSGSLLDFSGSDYPGISADGYYVYSDGTHVWRASVAGGAAPVQIDNPGDNGSAPSIADGTDPEVVYIKTPQLSNGDIVSGVIMSRRGTRPTVVVHNTGSWASVNKSGMIAFEDVDAGGKRQIYLALPLVHLLDPTVDLMSGPAVTSDVNLLATNGIERDGAAADGVARLVIRIDATGIDSADLELLDEAHQSLAASIGGSLAKRTGGSASTSLTLTPDTSTSGQRVLLAIYQAPSQFVRSGSTTDGTAISRDVTLHVRLTAAGQTSDLYPPIKIVRPPVLLVHGVWANASVWNNFGELAAASDNTRFYVGRANYPSDRDFQTAAAAVYQNIGETLKNFKDLKKVAAVQVVMVAHGMGAPVARTMTLMPNFLSDPGWPSFGSGPVNEMITIAGAHQGSGVANYLRDNACAADLLSNSLLSRIVWSQPTPMGNGAVQDLANCSSALRRINVLGSMTPFPVHTISARATQGSVAIIEGFVNTIGSLACAQFAHLDMATIIGQDNDLFVSAQSQQGFSALGGAAEAIVPPGDVHSPPFKALGGDRAELVDKTLISRVIQILEASQPAVFSRLPAAPLSGCNVCQDDLGQPISFTVSILQPPDNPAPNDSTVATNYSFLSTSTITAEASVSPVRDTATLSWNIVPKLFDIQKQTPPSQTGPKFSFMPSLPQDTYTKGTGCDDPGNGSCARSQPLSYIINASFCSATQMSTITQDQVDIIRQEYVNHGLDSCQNGDIPDRSDISLTVGTTSFRATELNQTAYTFSWGSPGTLAEAVRAEYNRLMSTDVQVKPIGAADLSPNEVIVRADSNSMNSIDNVGTVLYTRPCNRAPDPTTCTNSIAGTTIVAGASGKV